jgi:hypothetical protein
MLDAPSRPGDGQEMPPISSLFMPSSIFVDMALIVLCLVSFLSDSEQQHQYE